MYIEKTDGNLGGLMDGWTGGCMNKCILPKGDFFAGLCKCLITDLNHVFYALTLIANPYQARAWLH